MNFNESLEKLKESFNCVDQIVDESYEQSAMYGFQISNYDSQISNILWRMKHDIQKLEWLLRKREEEYLNNSKE